MTREARRFQLNFSGDLRRLVESLRDDPMKVEAALTDLRSAFAGKDWPGSRGYGINDALELTNSVLSVFERAGYMENPVSDPGHNTGHRLRDTFHALYLARRLERKVSGDLIFAGVAGGILHDIATMVQERYSDNQVIHPHAELGAAIFLTMTEKSGFDFDRESLNLISAAIGAHTYIASTKGPGPLPLPNREKPVRGDFLYYEKDGEYNFPIWFTKWVDRLDLANRAISPGRHFLTTVNPHVDSSDSYKSFFSIDFDAHIAPSMAEPDKVDRSRKTMCEHLRELAVSQCIGISKTNLHDPPEMVKLRDEYSLGLIELVGEVCANAGKGQRWGNVQAERFERWLGLIEPDQKGRQVAKELTKRFMALPDDKHLGWNRGFEMAMETFKKWSQKVRCEVSDFETYDRFDFNLITDPNL